MKAVPVHQYPQESLDYLLGGIPFFRGLKAKDKHQLDTLLSYSRIYEASPSDFVINKGTVDSNFYFLLKGQLVVMPDGDTNDSDYRVHISSGQVVGALSLLCNTTRTASIQADPAGGVCILFGTDFSPFGELKDFTMIRLPTKIAFYQMVVHSTRWRVEVQKMENPSHPLVAKIKKVEIFTGKKDSIEELESLDRQIRQLTDILSSWNEDTEYRSAKKASVELA
jgi:hypothetical protein